MCGALRCRPQGLVSAGFAKLEEVLYGFYKDCSPVRGNTMKIVSLSHSLHRRKVLAFWGYTWAGWPFQTFLP